MSRGLLTVIPRGVVLGDPTGAPIVVDADGIHASDGGGDAPSVAWSEVETAELDIPLGGPFARAWSWAWGMLVATVGAHVAARRTLTIEIETTDGLPVSLEAACATGAGYALADVRVAERLVARLLDEPGLRPKLGRDPDRVLEEVRERPR